MLIMRQGTDDLVLVMFRFTIWRKVVSVGFFIVAWLSSLSAPPCLLGPWVQSRLFKSCSVNETLV